MKIKTLMLLLITGTFLMVSCPVFGQFFSPQSSDSQKKVRTVKTNRTQPDRESVPADFDSIKEHTVNKVNHSKKLIDEFVVDAQKWLLTTGFQLTIILLIMAVALKSTSSFSNRLLKLFTKNKEGTELKKRAETLSSVIKYILIVLIVGIAGTMILKELGIDIGPILAGAGVVGLAVGFGAQNLVKDVISGFFILLEDQIRVGDVVQIADKSGVVERVTLRMVVLRDLSCNVHYIPSGEITVVTNMTKSFSAYVFDVGVAYREDVDEVIEIMKEIDEGLRKDADFKNVILEPLEVFGLDKFGDSAIIVRARTKTKPIEQWRVGREFNLRLKKRFDEAGIEIPFPHMTVYPGEDKKGNAPPLNISVSNVEERTTVGAGSSYSSN